MSSSESGRAPLQVLTVGHSNHTPDHLLGLLKQHDVEIVADVRSAPYSRYSPQFNRENLAGFLDHHGVRYEFLGDRLGGRPDDPECYDSASHVVYNRLEDTPDYQDGVEEIRQFLRQRRVLCLLCSEEDPETCHRALSIGHVLANQGVGVLHIRRDGNVQDQAKVIDKPVQASLFEEEPERKSLRPVLRERAPDSSSRS